MKVVKTARKTDAMTHTCQHVCKSL